MIGGGKEPGYQSGQIPWGFNESYRQSVRMGHCLGLDPCGGGMDGDAWRLFNLVCLLLLLGSHGLFLLLSAVNEKSQRIQFFLITPKASKGSLKQSLTLCVCVWANETKKKETQECSSKWEG